MTSSVAGILECVDVSSDLAGAQLGDVRRTRRAVQIAEAMARRPAGSIPQAIDSEADREAYYRFVGNKSVDWKSLLEPHFEATSARANALGKALVLHDTSEMSFPVRDGHMREHLAQCGGKTQGFSFHASLCCSADGTRAPLGLVSASAFVHRKELKKLADPEAARAFWREQKGLYNQEQLRWFRGIEQAEKCLKSLKKQLVHVLDREGDNYKLFERLLRAGYHFTIRLSADRRVKSGPRYWADFEKLSEMMARLEPMGHRLVDLSPRSKEREAQPLKRFPARRKRKARLEFRASYVELRRPDNQPKTAPETLSVWVVEARETNAPKGEPAVNWLLVTDQCCETLEQVLEVVDQYRARWLIEEFFKALKTGCGYEELQHRSAKSLLNALALKSVVAWQLLALRYLGQHYPETPAKAVVDERQLLILKHQRPRLFRQPEPTVSEVMSAVASLGGHIKQNGTPGWLVLGRGWQQLLQLEEGWRIAADHAQKRCDQS